MLTCKQTSRLVSESQERTLEFRERWGLKMHLGMCTSCRRFARQVHLLRLALRGLARHSEREVQGPELTPEARARIRKALAERGDHSQ
jgi:predicted anti-sigma-YlaC factor YlaD